MLRDVLASMPFRHTVLIACPETYDLVPTGMVAASVAELEAENLLGGCASCGGDHPWTPDDAVLVKEKF